MKLETQLLIGATPFPIISGTTTLELKGFGRASYLIRIGDQVPDLSGLVEYRQGYATDQLYPRFLGKVYLGQASGSGQMQIICRSLSSVLDTPALFSLRHLTAKDLLKQIADLTGLKFVYPQNAAYMNSRIPNFYNMDTARGAIERFEIWGVTRGIWTQLPDGTIFWGSWDDSPFADRDPVDIDPRIITDQRPDDRSFVIPVIPALQPGTLIQDSLIVEQLEIMGNNMRLRWLKN